MHCASVPIRSCRRPSVSFAPASCFRPTPSRLQAVLAHELGHIKRRDPLAQLLVQFVCAIYWFNPLVWIAARQIESDRERACDDLVLNHGVKASDYAQHLLEVVTGCNEDRLTACASVGMARPSRLEGRVVSILDERVNRRSIPRALLAVTLVATAVAIVPLAMIEAQAQQPPEAIAADDTSPPPISPGRSADDSVASMNAIDRLLHRRLQEEGIDLTKLKHPEKLTATQRLNMIRAFYRFFLKRQPSVEELKTADSNWSQSDYYRLAESLASQTFKSDTLPPPPAPRKPVPLPEAVIENKSADWPDAFPLTNKEGLGKPVWSTQMPGSQSYGQPVTRNGRIYIMDESGCLHCLDGKTGKQLWSEDKPNQVTDAFVARAYQDLAGRRPKGKANKMKLLHDLSAMWRARLHPKAPQPQDNNVELAAEPDALHPPDVVTPMPAVPAGDTTRASKRPRPAGGFHPPEAAGYDPAPRPPTVHVPTELPTAKPLAVPTKKRFRPNRPQPLNAAAAENPFFDAPEPAQPVPSLQPSRPRPLPSRKVTAVEEVPFATTMDRNIDPVDRAPKAPRSSPPMILDDIASNATAEPAFDPIVSNSRPQSTVVRDQRRELTKHWRDLVSAREQLRDSVKKRHQTGLASATDLNNADQALTESRIGHAKASNKESQIVKYLKELVSLREHRLKRQEILFKQGFVSQSDLLQAREKLIESKIRLAEAVIGDKVSTA
ncbi:MAG: M56 family metallopeptidase [Limisphaerales bacterium]